jgi:hypothetical protein
VDQALPFSACLCLLVGACSGNIEAVNTQGVTSTTVGSGGSNGITGAGGHTTSAGTGEGGATSATAGTGGISGAAGQGGVDPEEAGAAPPDSGMIPTDDGGALGPSVDAAGQDAGPPPAIDYSIWQLQLPTGSGTSPTTVPGSMLATFSNIYFYRADDGGQVFMDPATGVTTQNSTRCRTEFRESNPNGGAANWSPSGTNTMTVTGKVTKGGGITIAQVFNGGDGITLGELQYSSGGFTLFYEESRGGGSSTGLGNGTPLNTKYTFTMGFSKNVLTVTINGKQVFSRTPSAGILASNFYFKVGNYDQGTSKGTPGTTAHSIVEDYSIAVLHQP